MQPDGDGPVAYSPCRPDPLRRPTRRRARRRCRADPTADRAGVRRDRSAVRGRRRHAGGPERGPRGLPARRCTDAAGHPCSSPGRRAAESPELAGDVAGIAGSASVTRAGRSVYVTGSVTLDSDDIARARSPCPATRGDRARRRHPRVRPPGRPRPRRRPDAAHVPEHEPRRRHHASAPATSPGSPRSARASARRTSDPTLHTRSARPLTELPGRPRTLATDRVDHPRPRSPSSTVARSCSCTAPGPRP